MIARVPNIPVLLLALVVVAGAVLGVVLLTGDDDQAKVEVRSDGAPAPVATINRADDYGADVVRTYLQAALACTPAGARIMTELSRPGERAFRRLVRSACAASGGRPFAERLEAQVAREDLDERGRSLWRVEGARPALPEDLLLRVRQADDGWEIDRPCIKACPA